MQTRDEILSFIHAMIAAIDNAPPYPKPPEGYAVTLESHEAQWARGVEVPVTELCDLAQLDSVEVLRGSHAAKDPDSREPGAGTSRAYWHGWWTARMDADDELSDEAHQELRFRCWWWMLRNHPDVLRRITAVMPDCNFADPETYADLERALERGEPV